MYTLRSFLRTRFPQRPLGLGLVALVVAAYAALFLALFPRMGLGVVPLSAIWVGLAGWLLGPWGGLALGVLNFPLHRWLFGQVGQPAWELLLERPGFYVGLLLGLASGWMRRLLDRAKASEARYRSLVETAPLGVLVHDGERVLYANPEAGRVFGAERPQALVGRPVLSLVSSEDLPLVRSRLAALRQGQPQVELAEERLRRLDGAPVVAEVSAARVWYAGRSAIQVALRDLSAQRQLQGAVERLTYHDPVTGLPNRAALQEVGAKLLSLAQRQGWHLTALWLKLGDFASLREALGQRRVDLLLRRVGERLRRTTREQDWLAAGGGDEFVLLVQNATLTGVLRLARRLQLALGEPFTLEVEGHPVHLNPSIGIACYPENAADLDELLSAAYIAMQRARTEDCRLALFDPEGARQARERLALEEELRRALQETSGLPGWVAVNLSAHSFRDSGLIRFLQESLGQSEVHPGRLVLEITERTLADPQAAQPVLRQLKELGVQVAVDDFGTGYSSLSYLRSFPLDHLKVDRAFVRGIGHQPKDEAILRGIFFLAKSLGLECVAEGVESAEQAEWLRAEGCASAQGYHFARPMPLERLGTWVRSHKSLRSSS